ncbi:acyl-CoA:6-aminopenicillanic acid acyl transferase [Cytobacillus firmus]|uniref:Acyl-CoA:6-aminopenicillanic acid acyl transferase n=2 Tax=Cytobacillus TaxID=2675230 RepID=A0A366JE15_CYTFI|nr:MULTISPECIES: C45 family peptidase [Cytobacillus]RBP84525.1 acyl-CoA:6-aminopenicillanic acid acyl transferase [Cytobacillus firmus]TDX34570.1 acyl-CoA:6-aminopenicillanic acid acyl transferase [Cytobacillus oceanisediminis]
MNKSRSEKLLNRSTKSFPFYHFQGTHRQIGQQHGEACRELIHKNLEMATERLRRKYNVPTREEVIEAALKYHSYVQKYAPQFDEEIQGLAEGAGISLGESYLLQVRAELNKIFQTNQTECTTFAVASEVTADGSPLIGQNADLPAFYGELSVVIESIPDQGPATMMLTPAGQISFIGINDAGVGAFGNFVTCDGWRVGFPRYFLTKLALTCSTVAEAVNLVDSVYRASSRNLLMLDKQGGIADVETIPSKISLIEAKNGILAHSNHFVSPQLLDEERLTGIELENSRVRIARMEEMLDANRGKLNAEVMQDILRDRGSFPHCLCQIEGDEGMQAPGEKATDIITFASVIAEPAKGHLWIAIGPPDQYEYKKYSFSPRN